MLAIIYFVSVRSAKKQVIASMLIFALCCGIGYSDSFAFKTKSELLKNRCNEQSQQIFKAQGLNILEPLTVIRTKPHNTVFIFF